MFTIYENLLSKDQFNGLHQRLCSEPGWQFSNISDKPKEDEIGFIFWYKDLMTDDLFTKVLFQKICDVTETKFKLLRVYANGQTYGLSGELHVDSSKSNAYTFLYYTNPNWHLHWGGSTVFTEIKNPIKNKLTLPNQKSDISISEVNHFLPKPNAGIFYKSNITHAGLEPTRHCKELRITVSYKLLLE
jgi:hypothetical protein